MAKNTINQNTEKMVTVKLPRIPNNSEPVFVSVNERTFLVKRGEPVDVPECVAEVLRHSEEEEERAYQFEQELLSPKNR